MIPDAAAVSKPPSEDSSMDVSDKVKQPCEDLTDKEIDDIVGDNRTDESKVLKVEVPELVGTEQETEVLQAVSSTAPELELETLIQGDGNPVDPAATVAVHYAGRQVLADGSLGPVFDSSWDRGQPFFFKLGNNEVIKGWEQTVKQMTKGQKALVQIPSQLAYGEEGMPPVIPPNADLKFVIELLDWQL